MPDIQFEPVVIGVLNELIAYADRTPQATGFVCYRMEDGRTVEIRIREKHLTREDLKRTSDRTDEAMQKLKATLDDWEPENANS